MKVTCKLKILCIRDNIKQKDLAPLIGASKDQVNRWCNNRELPSPLYILRMNKVMGWAVEEMLEEE